MPFDLGQNRKVVFTTKPVIGPPPAPTAAMAASAAAYEGSAKQASDIAAYAQRPARARKMGVMKSPTFSPPGGTVPGSGGGAVAAPAEETPWYYNPWLWAVGAGLLFFGMKKK